MNLSWSFRTTAAVACSSFAIAWVCVQLFKSLSSASSQNGNGNKAKNGAVVGKVTQLWIYPIKSCGGFQVSRAQLTQFGFHRDREWVIAQRGTNTILTQRQNQRMRLIDVTLVETDHRDPALRLSSTMTTAEGGGALHDSIDVSFPPQPEPTGATTVELEKWKLRGTFVVEPNDEVNCWLSSILQEEVYLARCLIPRNPNETKYKETIRPTDRVLAHDFSPLHVVTEESLRWLQEKRQDYSLEMKRFRPNIVVSTVASGGSSAPFQEEDWKLFCVGDVPMRLSKGCARCAVPTVDDQGNLDPSFEPTRTLERHHALPVVKNSAIGGDPKPIFGTSVFHDDPNGHCSVEDNVVLLETC